MTRKKGLPRSARLARAEDFSRIKDVGTRARSGPLMVSATAGNRRRLGVVVTRRVGTAVDRNRIRRIVREHFRTNRDRMPHGDCVVIAHEGAAALTNEELATHMDRAASKLDNRLD